MATYLELQALAGNNALQQRVSIAICDKARAIVALPTPTAAQAAWAKEALTNPYASVPTLLNYVLVANKTLTTAQITAATDAAIQTNVDAAIDKILAA